ncbi:hyalin-like [Diadema antillarum]|uniref:hyalin-like n=1 Tax=Diadema antillarum TaxID=105358 RepID=UPI003A85FD06
MSPSMAGKILILACGLLAVCSSAQGQDCSTDTTPPVVNCSDVTLGQPFVNVFFGLTLNNGYTYVDVNPDFNGISYSLPTGPFGHRYPPGDTEVTLIARDLCDNVATCNFTVNNPLTELPVNCPDLTDTVSLSPGQATYTYTPTFGPGDVTLTTGVNYRYIGDNGVMVDVNVGVGNEAPVGVNQITTVISDDVLSKTCTSTLTVEDNEAPTVICPADATLSQSNLVYPEATASDNADPSPTVTYDPPASSLSLGTTTVTVNVTDSSSNSASCEFNVTVIAPTTAASTTSDPTTPAPAPGQSGSGSDSSSSSSSSSSEESDED